MAHGQDVFIQMFTCLHFAYLQDAAATVTGVSSTLPNHGRNPMTYPKCAHCYSLSQLIDPPFRHNNLRESFLQPLA